ncbi:hypothetical protein HY086_03400 [Candidatus Gottesmanbacteria bacterium]|nr:hypothetical protein [Candidatus Gottesmanbacteria bacterium]
MVGPEFSQSHELFDDGGHYRSFLEGAQISKTTWFLPSTSKLRCAVIQDVARDIGFPSLVKVVDGPIPEIGDTPQARAAHKVWHVADIILRDGFRSRHPTDFILILAADSRNAHGTVYRDKPDSIDTHEIFRDEWMRSVVDGVPIVDESGYALMAISGAQAFVTTRNDVVYLSPVSRSVVTRVFTPIAHTFELNRGNAHGLPTKEMILNHELSVRSADGRELSGREAVQRVYGASEPIIRELVLSALIHFAK